MLSSLWKKGTNFLGSEFAIMGGAMSWVSERNLVSAINQSIKYTLLCTNLTVKFTLTNIFINETCTQGRPYYLKAISSRQPFNKFYEIMNLGKW